MIELKVPFVMSIVGPRGKGKSYFGKTLLKYFIKEKIFDKIIIMTPSAHMNHDYDEFMTLHDVHKSKLTSGKQYLRDHIFVYDQFKCSDVESIMNAQIQCQKDINTKERLKDQLNSKHVRSDMQFDDYKLRSLLYDFDPDSKCPNTLLVMDDCIDSEILKPGGPVDVIAARGRHFKLSMMFMTQKLRSVSNLLRENAEYMIFFRTNLYTEMEKILEENVSRDDKKAMRYALKQVFNKDYHFVFINRNEGELELMLTYGTTQDFESDSMSSLMDLASEMPGKK